MDPAAASPGGQVVNAADQVASACRAAARLIAAGLSGLGPTATATAGAEGAGAAEPAAPPRRRVGDALPAATPTPAGPAGGAQPPSATARLPGGAPAEGLGVTVATVGLILLVLTALTLHGLVGSSSRHRWRSALESARAAGEDLRQRGEVRSMVVVAVVSIALWGLIVLWVLAR